MFTKQMEYRLKEVFKRDFFETSSTGFSFIKSSVDGKMELDLKITNRSLCINNLDKENAIPFLSEEKGYNKRADYAVFESLGDNRFRLHIFEMTTTVNQGKWKDKIKRQTKSAYVYCMAVATCLTVEIIDAVFYTVYENDRFEEWISEDYDHSLALMKLPSGRYSPNPKYEWDNGVVQFNFGEWYKYQHKKINVKKTDKNYPTGSYEI